MDSTLSHTDDVDEPRELLCPLSFVLFRDPVVVASGHTFERSALEEFWERRALANPYGGEPLSSASMVVNFLARGQVDAFLAAHPTLIPHGWHSREDAERSRSTGEELVRTARQWDVRAAAAKSGIDATLRGAAPTVWLEGTVPQHGKSSDASRRYVATRALGAYDLCDELPLCNDRYVYTRRGAPELMLWHVDYPAPAWCVGLREHLGQPRGVLFVRSAALLPEDHAGGWYMGRAPVPGLSCRADGARQPPCKHASRAGAQLLVPAALLGACAVGALVASARGAAGRAPPSLALPAPARAAALAHAAVDPLARVLSSSASSWRGGPTTLASAVAAACVSPVVVVSWLPK